PARVTSLVLVAFGAVYLVWGSTYLAIRIGVESFPPLLLAGFRHLPVGLLLYPILRRTTGIKPTAANWRAAVVTGALLQFAGNGGVSWAEQTVPSGITALLVATVSLWLVIVDWLRPGGLKPVPRVVIGLLMGFAGMALLVGPARLGGPEHCGPRGNLRVRESCGGAVPRLADSRGGHYFAHCRCRGNHPYGGHTGDHSAAPGARANHEACSSTWRGLIIPSICCPAFHCLRIILN